jgi:diacylglycerol kinase (ATP)
VRNPRAMLGARAGVWEHTLARLRQRRPLVCIDTVGDGRDRERVASLITSERPSAVVAAGGDGTLHDVVAALQRFDAARAPALGILPFGTGNNVARGLGLQSLRRGDAHALERAVAAIVDDSERRIDLGRAGAETFAGSFALGMDGAILAARNAWRRRWRLSPALAGYPLYLLSCAVNLARQRAVDGRVHVDGVPCNGPVYDLVVANTPLYAGEFRFDDGNDHSVDGQLELQIFTGAADYVRAFVTAWRRHVHQQRGEPIAPSPRQRRVTQVEIALARPLPSQLDGEESDRADRFEVSVMPGALRVRVPTR